MAETWVLNSTITGNGEFTADFTSNGKSFYSIAVSSSITSYGEKMGGNVIVYAKSSGWSNEAYRTIVFDTSPSGDLLTWLQANGTKQGGSEPDTPTSSRHVCLIDGTGYSIKQGKPLIAGTAYTLKKGRALIDGTGYDIAVSKKYTVTITGTIHVGYPDKNDGLGSYCKVGNDKYTTPVTVEAEPGTKIVVQAGSDDIYGQYATSTRVYFNGNIVAQGQDTSSVGIGAKYEFELNSNATITFESLNARRIFYNRAYITT